MRTIPEIRAAIERVEARRHNAGVAGRYQDAKVHAAALESLRDELDEHHARHAVAAHIEALEAEIDE